MAYQHSGIVSIGAAVALCLGMALPSTAQDLSPVEKIYAELAKLSPEERQAKLVEGAKKEAKLVMVDSLRGSLGKAHLDGFRKAYPFITVESSDMGSQDAAERLIAEETAGRHLTDVLSIGVPDVPVLFDQNRIARFPTPVTKNVLPKYKGFVDPENRWVPYYWSEYGMSFNTNLLKPADAPKAWFDLCKPEYKGKFSFDPPTTRFLVGMHAMMGEKKVEEWIKCIGANDPIIQRGHTARLKLMLRGDHAIQGGNYYYNGTALKAKNPNVPFQAVYEAPTLGYPGAIVINRFAANPYSAALMAEYSLSEGSQNTLRKAYRGTVGVKHAFMPDEAEVFTYNYFSAEIGSKMHDIWNKYVGRHGEK